MKHYSIGYSNNSLDIPTLALGLMRINTIDKSDAARLVSMSLELGINFFDHADIYGKGEAESFFSEVCAEAGITRESLILQSKCGIRPGIGYDFSKDYILNSVDGILKRLNTDYLDTLLLHRPDALVEPEEVAEAFDSLHNSGKVRFFGVSNHNSYQIELLNKYSNNKVVINQLQFGPAHTGMIDSGINVNKLCDGATDRDSSILDYCRLKEIKIQAWSPFQRDGTRNLFIENENFAMLNNKLDELAEKYNVTPSAVTVAWILRHPARIQTIVGTTKAKRLSEMAKAAEINLTREEWYEVYKAAGNKLP